MLWFVYLVKTSEDTLYCGCTNNLDKRIAAHNAGKGAKYTKTRRPVVLVYKESFSNKSDAMKREWQIKQYTRKEKLKLINKKYDKHKEITRSNKNEKCLHDACTECNGTGVRKDGLGICIHMISCPCPKCTPYSL